MTMVALCSSALEGVGATIAPSSQEEKGIWADLVRAAKASSTTGMAAPNATTWFNWTVPHALAA